MNKQTSLVLQLEIIWWIITILVLVVVLFPIYQTTANYPFWTINIIFIIVFITLVRHLFLLKYTFLGYNQWVKVTVLFICIPLVIFLINQMHSFQLYLDEIGIQDIFADLPDKRQMEMVNYVRTEMLLFGVGSIIATVFMPFRMLISYWRTHNRGTV